MLWRSRRGLLIAIALAAGSAGCDPGYGYQPVDPQGNVHTEWSATIDGVRFTERPFGILIGSRSIMESMEIVNESGQTVLVLGGQFSTGGRTIEAHVNDSPEGREARTVPPGTTRSVTLVWPLGGSASDVLGPDIAWVWRVRIGTAEHALQVPMRRTRG